MYYSMRVVGPPGPAANVTVEPGSSPRVFLTIEDSAGEVYVGLTPCEAGDLAAALEECADEIVARSER